MFCAITGHVPQEPVVSTKSGHLFERRVIEKHLAEHGTCPITNESLAKEDLLPVKGPAKLNPRPASATSIPGLLSLFQSEWDAVMLETFQLRQQLQGLRKELSAALYQNDAACRVIARLLREKEELVARGVPEAAEEAGDGRPAKRAKPAAEGIPPKAISDMVDVSKSLSSTRKARTKQAAEAAASADSFKSLDPVAYPVHTTAKGGIHSVALGANSLVATAGEDSTVRVFDYGKEEVVATLKGHGKRVHSVIFAGDSVVSGSADGTVRIWSASEGSQKSMLTDLVGAVTSVTLQPSGRYFAASASSGIWGLYDLAAASLLYKSPDPQSPTEYISSRFHPDGVLLGCATRAATVEIWDLPSGKTAPAATIAADGAVHSLSFRCGSQRTRARHCTPSRPICTRLLRQGRMHQPPHNPRATTCCRSSRDLAARTATSWQRLRTLASRSGTFARSSASTPSTSLAGASPARWPSTRPRSTSRWGRATWRCTRPRPGTCRGS